MASELDFAVSYVRPESPQLFFLFTGNAEKLSLNPMEFIQRTGIGGRNIVILRDPNRSCYLKGVSEACDSMDGIVRWQQEQMAGRFQHVREVFCVGTSGGAGPALYTASRLGARAAWSFGGRIARLGVIQERDQAKADLFAKILGRSNSGRATTEEKEKFARELEKPEFQDIRERFTENPDTILDRDWISGLADWIRRNRPPTEFHFYFATTNAVDCTFARAFQDCPGVNLHPIDPPPLEGAYLRGTFSRADHAIVKIMNSLGQLPPVFSAFL